MDLFLYILTFAFGGYCGFLLSALLVAAREQEERNRRRETWREREARLRPENIGDFQGGVYGCTEDMTPCDEWREEHECRACWRRPVRKGWPDEE